MKKLLFLIASVLLFSFNLKAKKVEGQICFEDDTLNVTIFVPTRIITGEINYHQMQKAVWYLDSQGKRSKCTAYDVKEIRFTYNYVKVRLLSRRNEIEKRRHSLRCPYIFLKLEMDGYLKLFTAFVNTFGHLYHVDSYTTSPSIFVLQKGDEELKKINGWSFKKNMRGYFNDCPQLAEKIETKEFKEGDIKLIVNTYNFDCQ